MNLIFIPECVDDRWGEDCQKNCCCPGGKCKKNTGRCFCPAGYKGDKCNTRKSSSEMNTITRINNKKLPISEFIAKWRKTKINTLRFDGNGSEWSTEVFYFGERECVERSRRVNFYNFVFYSMYAGRIWWRMYEDMWPLRWGNNFLWQYIGRMSGPITAFKMSGWI